MRARVNRWMGRLSQMGRDRATDSDDEQSRDRQSEGSQPDGHPSAPESLGLDQYLTVDHGSDGRELESAARAGSDVLSPWGDTLPGDLDENSPAAPVGEWGADILGEPYRARTLDLGTDAEGPAVATLVKRLPGAPLSAGEESRIGLVPDPKKLKLPPRFALIHLHGRNDYFFQVEMAAQLAAMGAAFYALDLRKFGRSLRPGQTIGYADDLVEYDDEIDRALAIVRDENPDLPIVLAGHSTGGLIAALWANRNPRTLAGVLLNSGWLELQTMTAMRPAVLQVVSRIAARRPRATVTTSKSDAYGRSLLDGWAKSEFTLPARLRGRENDPAVKGWQYSPEWKRMFSYPVPASWFKAILQGQTTIENEAHLDCPVLSMCSTASHSDEWAPTIFRSDVVLNADVIVDRSAHLADQVTIARFPGRHDLFLSDPDVREGVFATVEKWLQGWVLG